MPELSIDNCNHDCNFFLEPNNSNIKLVVSNRSSVTEHHDWNWYHFVAIFTKRKKCYVISTRAHRSTCDRARDLVRAPSTTVFRSNRVYILVDSREQSYLFPSIFFYNSVLIFWVNLEEKSPKSLLNSNTLSSNIQFRTWSTM